MTSLSNFSFQAEFSCNKPQPCGGWLRHQSYRNISVMHPPPQLQTAENNSGNYRRLLNIIRRSCIYWRMKGERLGFPSYWHETLQYPLIWGRSKGIKVHREYQDVMLEAYLKQIVEIKSFKKFFKYNKLYCIYTISMLQ